MTSLTWRISVSKRILTCHTSLTRTCYQRIQPHESERRGGEDHVQKERNAKPRAPKKSIQARLQANRCEDVTFSNQESLSKSLLLGTHSGVKLCRWTKAMLRGRGGCYKHTFYGIKSYQCMVATKFLLLEKE